MRKSSVVAAAIVACALAAPFTVNEAHAFGSQFLRAEVLAKTPQCRDHPNAPIVGRVVGDGSGEGGRGLSFVGCFDTMKACNDWRKFALSRVQGRLIHNRCNAR